MFIYKNNYKNILEETTMKNKSIKKITAFLSAVIISFSAASQNFSAIAAVDTTKTNIDLTYKRFDPQLIADEGEKLKEACSKKDNNDEVISYCKNICDLYYKFDTAYRLSNIMQLNGDNYEEYIYESTIIPTVYTSVSDALYAPLYESDYSSVISDTIPDPIKITVEAYHEYENTENTYNIIIAENTNTYNTLISDFIQGKYSIEEFELKCADAYLNIIKSYKNMLYEETPDVSLEDEFNALYSRDYSYDDISACKESIANTVSYLYNYGKQTEQSIIAQSDIEKLAQYSLNKSEDFDPINDILIKYTPYFSEEYTKNAQYLLDADLLMEGNPTATPAGYTIPFAEFNTPLIYISTPTDVNTAIFLTHEFGHFNAFCNIDLKNNIMDTINVDIAEVQSQGLEVLYLNYYDEIFGEFSDYIKISELNRLISILQLGCYVNDFEHDVFQAPESFTAEQVVKLFHEKQANYGIPAESQLPFGGTPNYINTPYYCISYAISLIPSLKLLEIYAEDPEKAKQIYYDYTKINAMDPENGFMDSMEKTGFGNILDSDSIDDLRYFLGDYCDSVEGIINGDISGDGNVSADDLVLLKKIMLGDIEEYDSRVADTNRDGKLSASDLTGLVYKLLQ